MPTLIRQTIRKARKKHYDDAYHWISESGILQLPSEYNVTFADMRKLVEIRRTHKHTIEPGEKYIEQCISDGGALYTVKLGIISHELCCKYDLYLND